jgi:hypothetical protein
MFDTCHHRITARAAFRQAKTCLKRVASSLSRRPLCWRSESAGFSTNHERASAAAKPPARPSSLTLQRASLRRWRPQPSALGVPRPCLIGAFLIIPELVRQQKWSQHLKDTFITVPPSLYPRFKVENGRSTETGCPIHSTPTLS